MLERGLLLEDLEIEVPYVLLSLLTAINQGLTCPYLSDLLSAESRSERFYSHLF
jgi:hypothetical protein